MLVWLYRTNILSAEWQQSLILWQRDSQEEEDADMQQISPLVLIRPDGSEEGSSEVIKEMGSSVGTSFTGRGNS